MDIDTPLNPPSLTQDPATSHIERLSPEKEALLAILRCTSRQASAPPAATVTRSQLAAGQTIGRLTGTETGAVTGLLEKDIDDISSGQLRPVEERLASQAVTLDVLFHHLTRFAIRDALPPGVFCTYMKLALRAQHQSAAALAALAEIKQGPRVVLAGQLNAAHQQIVNNPQADCGSSRSPKRSQRSQPRPPRNP